MKFFPLSILTLIFSLVFYKLFVMSQIFPNMVLLKISTPTVVSGTEWNQSFASPHSYFALSQPLLSDGFIGVLVGGLIGVLGTVIGTLVSHWLSLRQDRITREETRKEKLRDEIVLGASSAAKKIALSKIPFGGGGLQFPKPKLVDCDTVVGELQTVLKLAKEKGNEAIMVDVTEMTELFLERLKTYVSIKIDLEEKIE